MSSGAGAGASAVRRGAGASAVRRSGRRGRVLLALLALAVLVGRRWRSRLTATSSLAEPAGTAGTVPAVAGRTISTMPEPGPRLHDGVRVPGSPRLVSVVGGTRPHGETDLPPDVLLRPGRQVVGRAKDADVHLADTTVSPRHALLETSPEGRVVVRDLGARNGLSVDGVPVAEAVLHDGNRLDLGHVRLVFRSDPAEDDGGRQGGEKGEQSHQAAQGRD